MAQWVGQYSGHTHATKVEDLENALRQAVTALRVARPKDRQRKAKSVRNLAGLLLATRLKLYKVRLAALGHTLNGVESLLAREAQMRAEGESGILGEFGAVDALA